MASYKDPPPSVSETLVEPQTNVDLITRALSIRVRAPVYSGGVGIPSAVDKSPADVYDVDQNKSSGRRPAVLQDLPLEIQGLILDHLFGGVRPVNSKSSLQSASTRVSSAMRHPRRKAFADISLVSATWRDLVQERIYRHIKIKDTCEGLRESHAWFSENLHLAKHVRHIEFWVPVWADKLRHPSKLPFSTSATLPASPTARLSLNDSEDTCVATASPAKDMFDSASNKVRHNCDDRQSRNKPASATLSEIFLHVACFFPQAKIFTLEGGYCKQASLIRRFPDTVLSPLQRKLEALPNIRTFVMRGAWNIVREHSHWSLIAQALPGLQEWHCAYARPRPEIYMTMSSIFGRLPIQVRHVNISLDGFYCKSGVEDDGSLTSSSAASSGSTSPFSNELCQNPPHLCIELGRIAPQLETLSFTGQICDCFFKKAASVAQRSGQPSQLRAVDLVVKSCCRLFVVKRHPAIVTVPQPSATSDLGSSVSSMDVISNNSPIFTPLSHVTESSSDTTTESFSTTSDSPTVTVAEEHLDLLVPSPRPSDALTSITNMAFIRSFERLIYAAVQALHPSSLPSLNLIRIRHIDLDSVFPLLNPYFVFQDDEDSGGGERGRCTGVWNNEIIEQLSRSRPEAQGWHHLHDGIGMEGGVVASEDGSDLHFESEQGLEHDSLQSAGGGGGSNSPVLSSASSNGPASHDRAHHGRVHQCSGRRLGRKPTAIKGSAYRLLADAR